MYRRQSLAHQTDIPYLDKKQIDLYFEILADKIQAVAIGNHKILIVGGAAIAVKYENTRSTVDIDICFREQNKLYECCKEISEEYNLTDDWINADVMHSDSFSYKLFDNAVLYKKYTNLEIWIVDDVDLYCMKIVSFRPKDIQDMVIIGDLLCKKGVTLLDVETNFLRLYGSKYHLLNDGRKFQFVQMQLA